MAIAKYILLLLHSLLILFREAIKITKMLFQVENAEFCLESMHRQHLREIEILCMFKKKANHALKCDNCRVKQKLIHGKKESLRNTLKMLFFCQRFRRNKFRHSWHVCMYTNCLSAYELFPVKTCSTKYVHM